MDLNQFATALGARIDRAQMHQQAIEQAMDAYDINTPQRQAAFLAQIGHESGGLKFSTEVWGPTPAQSRYEGRRDLGNVQAGDGQRYLGRGWLQVTGRANYARMRDRLTAEFPELTVPDFEAQPQELAMPQWAALSAADYWDAHNLNELADAGDFVGITRKINGGLNGYDDRLARYDRALQVLA